MTPVDPINPEVPTEIEYKRPRRKYGWRPDVPSHTDRYHAIHARFLPDAVNLLARCPPVYDQGELGSCVLNSVAVAMRCELKRQGFPDWEPSRLFLYYNTRYLEGTLLEDAGAMIRDGVRAANLYGACYERLWPYRIERFRDLPDPVCFEIGENHQALDYARVAQTKSGLRGALADGFPVLVGVALYESFESVEVARTGIVPTPGLDVDAWGEPQGHCMVAIGYERYGDQVRYRVRNHWGPEWGDHGDCWMDERYLLNPNLADDFCIIQRME